MKETANNLAPILQMIRLINEKRLMNGFINLYKAV
jgi:hypothetical protein